MSKYQEWQVWKDAVDIAVEVMSLETIPELLSIQVQQTGVSISCKIAEGATGDRRSYDLARKAAARLETYLVLIDKLNDDKEPSPEALLSKLESIHAQLSAIMKKVKY